MNPTCHTYMMETMCFGCLNFKKISQNNMIMVVTWGSHIWTIWIQQNDFIFNNERWQIGNVQKAMLEVNQMLPCQKKGSFLKILTRVGEEIK